MTYPCLIAQPKTRRRAITALYAREMQLRRFRRVDPQGSPYFPPEIRAEIEEINRRVRCIESLGK